MPKCWEMRGCDEEMQSYCPHNIPGEPCPADCQFAACLRPTHAVATDPVVLLNLDHGPKVGEVEVPKRQGNPNRFLL